MRVLVLALFAGLAMTVAVTQPALAEGFDGERLRDIINSQSRPTYNRARDGARHPFETLEFFGITPEMTIAELWPGGDAYYSEIVGQYVAFDGQLVAVVPSLNPTSDSAKRNNERLFYRFENFEDLYDEPIITDLGKGDYDFAEAESLDAVLTFRNFHNWLQGGYDQDVLHAFFDALKPGGLLGLVDHRLDGSPHEDQVVWGGYITEAHVIELVEKAGFELVARSEVNANPKDTKDHPEGVWTLPPAMRHAESDRAKYMAIGESDRMTLMFRKPE